jgi:hypothetical protein
LCNAWDVHITSQAPEACEEGELDSGAGEDISNVDASVDELVAPQDFYHPTLGKSLVTPAIIKENEYFFF